ncbi:sulfotransferase family protein [Ekhidna sp.]|uniref:sulfotransferase family protein n=1 Tax=Ekhidna sp. TaxID=2608089 RepID=UPI003CCBD4A5
MYFPNLIIGGPPKTGTTSLYQWLKSHPDCYASPIKETFFFDDYINAYNKNLNFKNHGLSSYAKYFDGNNGEKILFEASTSYINSSTALEQIPLLHSNPKVLFVFRNPIDRIVSEYLFLKEKKQSVTVSFEDYLGWNGTDFTSLQFRRGKVVSQMNKWIKRMGEDNVIIIRFEDLKRPHILMNKLSELLRIDADFYSTYDFKKLNETFKVKNRTLHEVARRLGNRLPEPIKSTILKTYMKMNVSKVDKSIISTTMLEQLKMAYHNESEEFLLKKPLS